jgi:hypothetical protein
MPFVVTYPSQSLIATPVPAEGVVVPPVPLSVTHRKLIAVVKGIPSVVTKVLVVALITNKIMCGTIEAVAARASYNFT